MSKYANEPITIDGIRFHSKKEGYRWQDLRLMEKAGKISDLRRQVPFVICPKCTTRIGKVQVARKYIADFTYKDENGRQIVEDVKGYRTSVYKLKKALMLYFYGIEIQEV